MFIYNTIGLFGIAYAASTVSSMAGIGGGGMLIPLYAIVGNITLREAIVLSIVTIAGNTFVRGIYYVFKRHKVTRKRAMINYNIARVVVPFIGISSYLGYLINTLLPQIFIFAIIVIILGILIVKLLKKIYYYYKNNDINNDNIYIINDNENNWNESQLADRRGDSKLFVVNNILYIVTSFVISAFFSYIIKNNDSLLVSIGYYIIQIIILLLIVHMNIIHINDIYKQRKAKGFNWLRGDIDWFNKVNYLKFGIAGLFTGFFSSMLGIGGSMIINPIMIDLNVVPDVVVATSSLLSFFASVIAIILYIGNSLTIYWYYPILFMLGSLGGATGILLINLFRKRSKIVILFTLTICMICSLILLFVHQIFIFIDL